MAFPGIPWKEIESFLDGAIGQTIESILSGQADQEAEMRARVDAGVTRGLDALAAEVVAESSKRTAFIGGGAALPDLFPLGGWPTLIASIGADFTLTLREELTMLCKLGYLYEPEHNRELRRREAIAILAAVKGDDKGGELAGTAEVGKLVAMMGAKHAAERLLMHVGRKFFQKKLLAFIPGLGILLSGGVNYFSTRSLGDYAIVYYNKRRKQGPGPAVADLEFQRLKTSQLRILVAMARADGSISPAEEELYRDSLLVFGLTPAEQASALAVDCVRKDLLEIPPELLHSARTEPDLLQHQLERAITQANDCVWRAAARHAHLRGMGTTLTLAFFLEPHLLVAHAGDSRCCLIRDGQLHRLTRDHTLAQEMLDRGRVGPDDSMPGAWRHILTNSVGGSESAIRVDGCRIAPQAGDSLLLCSDGLTDMLNDVRIGQIVRDGQEPHAICRQLIHQAKEAGGRDNITAIFAQFHPAQAT